LANGSEAFARKRLTQLQPIWAKRDKGQSVINAMARLPQQIGAAAKQEKFHGWQSGPTD
jgi:hypothetical protein